LAFDISEIITISIAALAVIVSVLSWTRSRKSEQVRISKEIWDDIGPRIRAIHEWPFERGEPDFIKLKREMDFVKNDLGYFVFFVEKGEIRDRDILEYYNDRMNDVDKNMQRIMNNYLITKEWEEVKEILEFIKKYFKLTKR